MGSNVSGQCKPCQLQIETDPILQYRNPWNQVRVGKLLEDLDSLAGNIAFQHW